jgi:ATPase family AAA domain-containing protein 2
LPLLEVVTHGTNRLQENRQEFFARIITHIRRFPKDFPDPTHRKKRVLEELPVAPAPPPKIQSKEEIKAERIRYRQLLNVLKVHLQPIMDQINRKYKKFRLPVIAQQQYQYLFDEQDPNYVMPDIEGAVLRPFEKSKDKHGTEGLRETATGKFFYNLDIQTIEERLANGYYHKPMAFLKDITTLESDAKAIGDRERHLKARELLANVEVDVMDIDTKFKGIDWEMEYKKELAHLSREKEKTRKKDAMQSVVDLVQSDVGSDENKAQNGQPQPELPTTSAHFQPIVPQSNGTQHSGTNGTSVPSRGDGEDVPMTDAEQPPLPGPNSQMQPPSQWPGMEPHSAETSTRATAGGASQISQVHAVQSLPPGMSPSALVNDASTTKTSDPSSRSTNFSTQVTNGIHNEQSSPVEQIPDTQPYPGTSQATSSDDQWPHSQAHGLARGYLQTAGSSQSSRPNPSSAGTKSSHPTGMANLLNDTSPDEPSQSQRQSDSSGAQQVELDDEAAKFLLGELTRRTSGFTIEQLEQINRELMAEIWRTKGEHNRMKVYNSVIRVFNEAINDIEAMQRVLQLSQ